MNALMYYSQVFPLRSRGSPAKLHKASPAGNPEIAKAPIDFQFSDLTMSTPSRVSLQAKPR
jgi:hypothetical protein